MTAERKHNRRLWRKHCARRRLERRPCHLCKEPIDYTLPYIDPTTGKINLGSFSGDHIIPWADGGPDTYENCGPSHYGCNVRRRHAPLPDQPTPAIVTSTPSETW